ncbi:MAG: beta-lactamase family protein [Symploca sp. SIO2C1]|nr:beta-lactamase family protein [Symploca sp. SIO2C1]
MPQETIDRVLEEADELLISAMNEAVITGMAVGIIHQGKLIYAKSLGLAEVKSEKVITPDTVFRIGSISKTFTAIGLMQLWEQGKFQLDDPINDYLKTYQVKHRNPEAPPVTFRHLLTHTSGIGELRGIADMLQYLGGLSVKQDQPVPTLREYYAKRLTPEIYPGTKWAYANHAFATLGQLVEDISTEPFSDYMIRHVFEPLGMTQTDYLLSERVRHQLAQGYLFNQGKLTPINYREIVVRGAGSIFSSLNDMSKYVVALLNGGKNEHGTILQPETLELMLKNQYQLDEHLDAMGLAFLLDNFDGHRIIWHNGGWPGFVSSMWIAPDDDLGVIIFTNSSSGVLDSIAKNLLRRLLEVPKPASELPRANILGSPHLWTQLSGCYRPKKGWNTNWRIWLGFGGELEVFVKDNHLMLRSLIGPLGKGIIPNPVIVGYLSKSPNLFQTKALIFFNRPLVKRIWYYPLSYRYQKSLGVPWFT